MAAKDVSAYFRYIKDNVAGAWKDLAYQLGVSHPDVEDIDDNHKNYRSRCSSMLQKWKIDNGDAATIHVLMEALKDLKLMSVLHGLKKEFPELSKNPGQSGSNRGASSSGPSRKRPPTRSSTSEVPNKKKRGAGVDVEEFFEDVIDNVSHKWDDLARKLGFKDSKIKGIQRSEPDDDHRCREMLNRWRNKNGRKATLQVLMQALIDIGEAQTAESLEDDKSSGESSPSSDE